MTIKLQSQRKKKNKASFLCKSIISSLIWKQDRSKTFQIAIEVLSNLQLIGITLFGLDICSLPSPDNSFPQIVQNIAKLFSVIDDLASTSDSAWNSSMLILISIYFLFIISLFASVGYKFNRGKKISRFHQDCITYCGQFHHSFLFWNINMFLMCIVANSNSKRAAIFDINNFNIGILTTSIILIIINYLYAAMGSMFCYDPFLSNNMFASHSSKFQFITFLSKALMGPALTFIIDEHMLKWVFVILSMIFTLLRNEILFLDMPYYNLSAFKLTSFVAGCALSIAIINTVAAILSHSNPITSLDLVYIQLLLVILFLVLSLLRISYTSNKVRSLPDTELKNPTDVLRKMIAVINLCQTAKLLLNPDSNQVCNQELLNLVGSLPNDYNNNNNPESLRHCILKNESIRKSLFEVHKLSSQSKIYVASEVLKKAIKVFKSNHKFKILLAYILLKEESKFPAALFTIFSSSGSRKSLQEDILIFYVTQQLEEEIAIYSHKIKGQNGDGENLDLKQIVDFERISNKLFALIEQNTKTYIQLWTYFLQPSISLRHFIMKSTKVEKEAAAVEKVWNKLDSKFKHSSSQIYAVFCAYLTIIRNAPYRAKETFNTNKNSLKHKKSGIHHNIQKEIKLDNDANIIFHVSMSRDKFGHILYASRNIYAEFEWLQSDLINQNINTVQSLFIKERHDQLMINHIEGIQEQPFRTSFGAFMATKSGYTVPINGYVTVFPYIDKEPIYTGVFQKEKMTQELIIVGPNGVVDSFSEGIAKKLKLSSATKVHVQQIPLNFEYCKPVMTPELKKKLIKDFEGSESVDQTMMTFQGTSLLITDRDVAYVTKIENKCILEQTFFCLYLNEESPQGSFQTKSEKIQTEKEYSEEELSDKIPREFDISTKRNLTKRTERSFLIPSLTKIQRRKEELRSNFEETGFTQRSSNNRDILGLKNVGFTETDRISLAGGFIETDATGRAISLHDRTRSNQKMEKALYVVPKQKYMRVLDFLIIIYGLICTSLMFYHLYESSSEFDSVNKKTEFITIYHRRVLTLIGINHDVRVLTLISKGIISDTRHISIGIPSWRAQLQNSLAEKITYLHLLNHRVDLTLDIFDEGAMKALYNIQVKVRERDSMDDRTTSIFGVFAELLNAANGIARLDPSEVIPTHPDVKFILDNVLNTPFETSELILKNLVGNMIDNFFRIREKLVVSLLISIATGVVITIVLLADVKQFINKRNRLANLLLKLDENMLREHLKDVNFFHRSLESTLFNKQTYLEIKFSAMYAIKTNRAKGNRIKGRIGTKKELNLQMIKDLFSIIMALIGFASVFVVLNIKFNLNLSTFLDKINKIIQISVLNTKLHVLNCAILEYISENNSTQILNRPVEEFITDALNDSEFAPLVLTGLITSAETTNESLLRLVILEDLCQAISLSEYTSSICSNLLGTIGAKGLITITPFLVHGLEESKNFYDQSNHTLEAAFESLNTRNKILGEEIASFPHKAILILEDIMKDDLKQEVTFYSEQFVKIIFLYAGIYLGIGLILSLKVWKRLKNERNDWRKVFRQIPFSIILSNKALKTYIINDCEHIMDPFKSVI